MHSAATETISGLGRRANPSIKAKLPVNAIVAPTDNLFNCATVGHAKTSTFVIERM